MSPATPQALLRTYDAQLRGAAEMRSADQIERHGPLCYGLYGDRGFVSYHSLEGVTGAALDRLIAHTAEYYAAQPGVLSFEWKTRGHDEPQDLPERLLARGFEAEPRETVMIGEARDVARPVGLPSGVTLRRIDLQPNPAEDLQRAADAQERAFGYAFGVDDLMRRLKRNRDHLELWVAEADGQVITVGRLEVVPETEFAGLWGGGTVPEYRGRGIYRALTAARAQSAVRRGVRYLHSDCTDFSRPILARSGLQAVTTTTPYVWHRP